ncbi:WecB/TagA/CpsF family glycosyltransferase [Sphingomonas naphthae]|uniref:WecB/TagA/CpsF family glycosyltransferase n=1 Tax=Sphingomonas naphthae TaxID=1813468 RepID=A0ABY7TJ99_9SPHN|nr:WecB/TagA/CpsF family glycosyltransferase [Sphingomonas naphthae]WCT73234.1 WecB/TagA/CpsF family glycosyltransferase [Sphingomonas naphthae]
MPRPVFGLDFWDESVEELAHRIATEDVPAGEGVRMVATANIDHIVRLHENVAFRQSYDDAWAVTADGWPVVLYARLFGRYRQGRVTGADLFPRIVTRLSPTRHRMFCLTSSERTAGKLLERLDQEGIPRSAVETCVPPYGFEKDEAYSRALAERIRDFGTTHLFMGVGAPKSEIWVDTHRDTLGDLYACCFGAALNFYAGTRRRAPMAFQAIGMEWCWRLLTEPKRLAMRYLEGGPKYLVIAIRDMLNGGARQV